MNLFPKVLEFLRKKENLTQEQLAKELHISRSAIGMYEKGNRKPDQKTLRLFSAYFGVDMNYLVGGPTKEDYQMYEHLLNDIFGVKAAPYENVKQQYLEQFLAMRTYKLNSTRICVFGEIPANIHIEEAPHIADWDEIPADWQQDGHQYIGIRIVTDFMEPQYIPGDTVIVKLQPDCESGEYAIVYVKGYNAMLRRVIKTEKGIILQPINVKYMPQLFYYDDPRFEIKIIGVVIELRRRI